MSAMDHLISDSGATGLSGASLSGDTVGSAITCKMQLQLPAFLLCNNLHFRSATFYIFILQQTLCQLLKRMKPHRIKLCALIITNFFFPYFSKFSSSGTLALLYAIISLPPSLLLMKEPFTKINRELFRFNPCLSFDEVKIKPNRLT